MVDTSYCSSVHSDMDRSRFSRAVTKLSRSMAVTTPNTMCFIIVDPSVKSEKDRIRPHFEYQIIIHFKKCKKGSAILSKHYHASHFIKSSFTTPYI